jgi:protein tyrosine phosphatase
MGNKVGGHKIKNKKYGGKDPTLEELMEVFGDDSLEGNTYEFLLNKYNALNNIKMPSTEEYLELLKNNNKNQKLGGDENDCRDVIKAIDEKNNQELDELYPPEESYLVKSYQALKSLKSYSNIHGMQLISILDNNCAVVYKFLKFLQQVHNITYFVCLQCDYADDINIFWRQHMLKSSAPVYYFRRPIKDYNPYTYECAMQIIALIEYIGDNRIVFHCTAGFGRTGSVMCLLLMYFKCIQNPNLLSYELPIGVLPSDLIANSLLATEYSLDSANEFYIYSRLRSTRINILIKAIADSLQIYHPTGNRIAYRQYLNLVNTNLQESKISEPLDEQIRKEIISLHTQKIENDKIESINKTLTTKGSNNIGITKETVMDFGRLAFENNKLLLKLANQLKKQKNKEYGEEVMLTMEYRGSVHNITYRMMKLSITLPFMPYLVGSQECIDFASHTGGMKLINKYIEVDGVKYDIYRSTKYRYDTTYYLFVGADLKQKYSEAELEMMCWIAYEQIYNYLISGGGLDI